MEKVERFNAVAARDMGVALIDRLYDLATVNIDQIFEPLWVLGDSSVKIWLVLKRDGPQTFAEIMRTTGLPKTSTSRGLTKLQANEMIDVDGYFYKLRPAWRAEPGTGTNP